MTEWTNENIALLHLKKDAPTNYKIGGTSGAKNLYLHVIPSGGKSWQHRKQVKGKRITKSLGPFPEVPLEEAAQKAIKLNRKYWEENNDKTF